MLNLESSYICNRKGHLTVVPKSDGKPTGKFIDPVKNLLLLLMESRDVRFKEEAYEELMKIREFRDIRDDIEFCGFEDVIGPDTKGYKRCELYRLINEQLKQAGAIGLSDEEIRNWFHALTPKSA